MKVRQNIKNALVMGVLATALTTGLSACFPFSSRAANPAGETGTNDPTDYPYSNSDYPAGITFEDPEFSGPTMETVTMLDPVAASFTAEVPLGWDSTLFSTGTFGDHRQTVISVSPDGLTIIFSGDPYLPFYWSPSHPDNQTEAAQFLINESSTTEWREYEPATTWVEQWTVDKFGGLDGFAILGTEELPDEAAEATQILEESLGIPVFVTAARTHFQYETDIGTMSGIVNGSTQDGGQFWNASVSGLSTIGDPYDYEPMVDALARSSRITPEWSQRQDQYWRDIQAQSDAFTQQLTDNHNANMAWIRDSSMAHQAKMEGIWAANDASMNNYYTRMSAMDDNQRSFLNYIQGENTVQTSTGQTFQVAQGADVYFVNPSTGATVGGNSAFSSQDLAEMGLNPSEWSATQVVH